MMPGALVVWGVGSHGVHGICLVFVGCVETVHLWGRVCSWRKPCGIQLCD